MSDYLGLCRAAQQAAIKLHEIDRPDARSLAVELADLLAAVSTPPTRLSRVLDDARKLLTEVAAKVEAEQAEQAFAMERMAARKQQALDEAIAAAGESFAKLFVAAMRIGRGEQIETKAAILAKKELRAADAEVDETFAKAFRLGLGIERR